MLRSAIMRALPFKLKAQLREVDAQYNLHKLAWDIYLGFNEKTVITFVVDDIDRTELGTIQLDDAVAAWLEMLSIEDLLPGKTYAHP